MKRLFKFFEDLYKKTPFWKNKINIDSTLSANSFGCYDSKNECYRPGYITNNGKMKYGKPIFNVWDEPVAKSTWEQKGNLYSSSLFSSKVDVVPTYKSGVIYSQLNKYTGKKRYFIGSPTRRIYIDNEALEKFGRVIEL